MSYKKFLTIIMGCTAMLFLLLGYLGAVEKDAAGDTKRELKLARELARQESQLKKEELRRQKAGDARRQAEALAREKEELRRQKILENKRLKEALQAKKERLRRQREEAQEEEQARQRQRQWQLAEEERQRQEELEERRFQAQGQRGIVEQITDDARQAKQQEEEGRRQELAAQNKFKQQELAEEKEEEARRLQEIRQELRVKEERRIWQLAQERKDIERQLAAAALERQLKNEAARKAQEQAKLEAQARKEDQRRNEEIARGRRIDELQAEKRQEEIRQQELKLEASLKEEVRRRQELEAKQRNYEELASRRAAILNRLEFARQAREEAETELKIRQEEKLKAKALARLRQEQQQQGLQERLKKEEAASQARKSELAAAKEEAARLEKAGEEERLKKSAEEKKRKLEEEANKKQEELRLKAAAEERRQSELTVRQEELAKKEQELQKKLKESTLQAVQSKAMTEVMLVKQREDNAKIYKIEQLWRKARKLYTLEKYEDASRLFQEIIELEGNPRVKYTPYAKMYIEKAKNKIEEQKKYVASLDIEHMEKEMAQQVLIKQMPPYLEPPKKSEAKSLKGEERLIEMPLIRKKLQKQITLDFDKLDLKTVLNFISQEAGINIIASQKVLELALKVTARFKDTIAEEAIKYITKSLGLIYRIDKDLIWIAHPEEIAKEPLETRVYYLSKGVGLFTEFSPMSSASSSGETSLGGSSAQITKILTLEDTLKEAIPWPTDSKLVFDKRVNALMARNTPQNLQMLEDILYSVDVTPFQILIEARFIEVELTDTEELGLEWKIDTNLPTGSRAKNKGGGDKLIVAKDSGVDFTAFTRASEGFNLTYKGLLTSPQFQAVLHALSESKKVKTLSCPRITTLNNQLATMKVVDEWIYPTRYEYEIVQVDLNGDGLFTGTGETTYKNVPKDFLRRDVGILLKVVPSMGADKKTISLALIPEVSEGTASGFSYSGEVTLPKFTSRNLSTTVVVKSGDTVVLGGLVKESRTKTVTKVPFFGDVPLVGAFFKKNTDSIVRKNLLIFVTAKVLSPSGEEVVAP
jgi:type II secretory pathway component GspD/PulD (secretin)